MLSFFVPTETHLPLTIDDKNTNRNENVGLDRDRETTKMSAIAGNWCTQREQLEGREKELEPQKSAKAILPSINGYASKQKKKGTKRRKRKITIDQLRHHTSD